MTMARIKRLIIRLLNEHRVMTIATNRLDGWPQATIVGYVNDGFLLYCFAARNSQKYANILRDPRVSIASGSDASQPLDIKGISLAGKACVVTDQCELSHAAALRLKRYPEYAALPPPVVRDGDLQHLVSEPSPSGVVLFRIVPEIFSVLDYSRGFGHSDLVSFSERDLDLHMQTLGHRWDGNAQPGPP